MRPAIIALFCGASIWMSAGAEAQEPPPTTPDANSEAPSVTPVTNVAASATNALSSKAEQTRDPFWPVGYMPEVKKEVVVQTNDAPVDIKPVLPISAADLPKEKLAQLKAKIRIGGFLKQGDDYVALVNDQLVKQGDKIIVEFEGAKFKFIIRAVTEKNVSMEPL